MANEFSKPESVVEELAVALHSLLCRYNHSSQCGWRIENSWKDWTHRKYLDMAQSIVDISDESDYAILTIVKLIDEVRI